MTTAAGWVPAQELGLEVEEGACEELPAEKWQAEVDFLRVLQNLMTL